MIGQTISHRQDSKSLRWIIALLCIFTLTGLILNIHWISEDKRPTAYDDSWYLENAFNLWLPGTVEVFCHPHRAELGRAVGTGVEHDRTVVQLNRLTLVVTDR